VAVTRTIEYEAVPAVAPDAHPSAAGIVVMKFGGTSVGDPEKIKHVARRLVAARERGARVIGVISAMGQTTDELISLAHQVSASPDPRELDMLLTVGERISCALVAMAINDLGREAVSLTGSQAGIVTDTVHGKAKIVEVRARRIHQSLDRDRIVLVAGFQGISRDLDLTTLGRGGTDTTAVALAAALGAEVCEIYTDVEGVFTADPRLVSDARKLHAVSYEEMLEMAAAGAKVLQLRSVELARNHGVRVHVRTSLGDEPGTWVIEEDVRMEQAIISGVAADDSVAKITLQGIPDRPGSAAAIFRAVAEDGAGVDMIVQNVGREGRADVSFLVPKTDLTHVSALLDRVLKDVGGLGYTTDHAVARVSLVGAGIKSNPAVVADMFDALAAEKINIEMISTSSIRISCVIRAGDKDRAVRCIHAKFGLGDDGGAVREHG
jgi:aspartate kinase